MRMTSCPDHEDAMPDVRACTELPVALWQSIYFLVSSQHDTCSGMQACKLFRQSLPEVLQHAVVHDTCWDQVPGGPGLQFPSHQ